MTDRYQPCAGAPPSDGSNKARFMRPLNYFGVSTATRSCADIGSTGKDCPSRRYRNVRGSRGEPSFVRSE